ncbi:MAG: hypothetical protein ACH6QR_00080 [Candidatus Carsonella ruddii]
MKKNFCFLISNNINCLSNFYNFLTQINLKIIFLKIKKNNNSHFKIIYINDSFYKINQFLKLLSKCLNIVKIFFLKNINFFLSKFFFLLKKVKIYKNFIFIFLLNKYYFYINVKKKNYVSSIMNNFLF